MKQFEIKWKASTGIKPELERVQADVIQPAGGAVALLRASAVAGADGQRTMELVKLINFDSIDYVEKVELLN